MCIWFMLNRLCPTHLCSGRFKLESLNQFKSSIFYKSKYTDKYTDTQKGDRTYRH